MEINIANSASLKPLLIVKKDLLIIKFYSNKTTHQITKFNFKQNITSFKIDINISSENDGDYKCYEIKLNLNDNNLPNTVKTTLNSFIGNLNGTNSLKVKLKFKEDKKNIITERTGTAVTSNEEDEDDE